MREEIAKILDVSVEELNNNSKRVEEINATFYWNPIRGGNQILVSDDGSYLASNSGVNYEALLEEFKNGKRNGNFCLLEEFIANKLNPIDPFWGDATRDFFNALPEVSIDDKNKLIKKFDADIDFYNRFSKELLSATDKLELFNKYNNME